MFLWLLSSTFLVNASVIFSIAWGVSFPITLSLGESVWLFFPTENWLLKSLNMRQSGNWKITNEKKKCKLYSTSNYLVKKFSHFAHVMSLSVLGRKRFAFPFSMRNNVRLTSLKIGANLGFLKSRSCSNVPNSWVTPLYILLPNFIYIFKVLLSNSFLVFLNIFQIFPFNTVCFSFSFSPILALCTIFPKVFVHLPAHTYKLECIQFLIHWV